MTRSTAPRPCTPSPTPSSPRTGLASPGYGSDSNEVTLLAALPIFRLQPDGFTNRDLRPLIAQLRGVTPEAITTGQISYDLRRLRHHDLIQRIPHSHRYRVTDTGL